MVKGRLSQRPVSQNNREWFLKRYLSINEASGGSLVGKGLFGETVIDCEYGEVAWKVDSQGELLVDFLDRGVICCYMANGDLGFVSIDLSLFFDNLTEDDLDEMAHQGDDIITLTNSLEMNGETLYLTVFPTLASVKVDLMRDDISIAERLSEEADFSLGFGGKISLDEAKIVYQIIRQGDEFVVSAGESDGVWTTLCPLSVSHHVDFVQDLMGKDPKRFQKLVRSIILND